MIKVIAIGNRLMKDDGIAISVTENIRSKLELLGFEVIIGETDFQFCFHLLKANEFIILLDALCTGSTIGSTPIYNLQEISSQCIKQNSQHDRDVFNLMRLYAKPLKGYLIGIEIAEIGFGLELSEVLKHKFKGICQEIEGLIQEIAEEGQDARYLP